MPVILSLPHPALEHNGGPHPQGNCHQMTPPPPRPPHPTPQETNCACQDGRGYIAPLISPLFGDPKTAGLCSHFHFTLVWGSPWWQG